MTAPARMRFEVLRRDGFRCRYCGTAAEDGATLHVDHVIPESLGGETHPRNLVAACAGCNAGKSSTTLDSEHVEQIDAANERHAAALRQAIDAAVNGNPGGLTADDISRFTFEWFKYSLENGSEIPLPAPSEVVPTINTWIRRGFTLPDLVALVAPAMRGKNVRPENRWRYFCGVVWNTLSDAEKRVHAYG